MTSFVLQNFIIGSDDLPGSDSLRLEETIIFCDHDPREAENAATHTPYGPITLMERSQFAHNPKIYEKGACRALSDISFRGSWLQWFLKETETFHAM